MFVDWSDFKKNLYDTKIKAKLQTNKDLSNNLYWNDIITHTQFYISKQYYDEQKTKAFNDLKEKQTVLEIYQYIENPPNMNFFMLPVFLNKHNVTKKILQRHRNKDHVLIRTCLLLCKYYNEEPKIIDELRCIGLLYNIFEENLPLYTKSKNALGDKYNEVIDFLEAVDKFLIEETELDEKYDFTFDIVKGGAIKIKNYYLETNDISNIRGASMLLDEINKKYIPELVYKELFKESIIYCGGGKTLLFVPDGKGEKLKKDLSKLIKEKTITCQSNFGCRKTKLSELSSNIYKYTMNNFDMALENQGNATTFFDNIDDDIEVYSDENSPLCEDCKLRKAVKNKLCGSCENKTRHDYCKKANNESSLGFVEDFIKFAKNKNLPIGVANNGTLEDIAKNGATNSNNTDIAIIYGDGNNMSLAIDDITSIAQMKYFSEMIDESIKDIVYYALAKVLKNTCFNIIALGGDDLFIIVPANKALDICLLIGKLFDKYFENLSREKENIKPSITMSLGFCISKYRTPIQYTFEYVQQLLKTAKKKAWDLRNTENTGTLDFMVLKNENTIGYPVNYIRKLRYNHVYEDKSKKYVDTLRPYTWKEAEKIKQTITDLSDYKTMILDFKDAITKMHPEEAKLYINYQITRDLKEEDKKLNKKHKVVEVIEDLAQVFNKNSNEVIEDLTQVFNKNSNELFLGLNYEGSIFTPWLDLSELWDFSGGDIVE